MNLYDYPSSRMEELAADGVRLLLMVLIVPFMFPFFVLGHTAETIGYWWRRRFS